MTIVSNQSSRDVKVNGSIIKPFATEEWFGNYFEIETDIGISIVKFDPISDYSEIVPDSSGLKFSINRMLNTELIIRN